jgi:CubicO group peptidase (beta-lactamase class C family)
MNDVEGFVTPGFERVAELLAQGTSVSVGGRERTADLGAGGGAFAAYVDGERVVDIWAGSARPGQRWAEDTRAVVMSATKGLTTLCAHVLYDRAQLDLDLPVVAYWPEFGAAGKDRTTVRQLLSHQSGAIGLPEPARILSWDGAGWDDTVAIAAALASASPAWVSGSRHGYHGVTFGWLIGELVRRISGKSLGTFFREDVAGRFGLACDIGTPLERQGTVAQVIEWTRSSSRPSTLAAIDPDSWAGRSVIAGPEGNLFADEHGAPRFAAFMNMSVVQRAEIGALGATGTARALARLYAALARGEDLVSRTSVDDFREQQVCGRDAVMGVPTRWAVGYTREPPALVPDALRQHGPNDEAFGHMGAGGQIGFADPVAGVGCGFVRNHLEHQAMPLMGAVLVDALYQCLGAQ